ncbi:MAG: ATP-dependent helicase [Propionibacteriales bacterium]|nr:ATP-dependent helicase [Propionibacteriales bacterium]
MTTATVAPVTTTPAELRALMDMDYSDQQMAAITAPLQPNVIVAGAGSGKTTVMAARVVWLVATGRVQADQILGLTFTNKASAELGHRVRGSLVEAGLLRRPGVHVEAGGDEPLEPTVLTYHAYAARLLAEHGLRLGHEPDTRLVTDASRFQLAARAIRRYAGAVEHLSTWVASSVSGLLALDAEMSEHLVTPSQVRRFQAAEAPLWEQAKQTADVKKVLDTLAKRGELLGFVEGYRTLKRELGVMDFSDQMALGAELAATCPEVGRAERDRYKVVLLDEYQDTSVAQAQLLQALFSGATAETGRGHPVTAVGDPCQAIYGWRGASVSNIEQFGRDFPASSDVVAPTPYPLSVNRRSAARILTTANAVASDLYAVHSGAEPLAPVQSARKGVVRAAVLETHDDELRFLAREVPAAYAAMPQPTWSQIGVLVRDNKTAGDVQAALVSAGVPVEVVGLSGLLSMPEVGEVVAMLQVVHDVTANASLLTLLAGPRWAIGIRDLALLGERAQRLAFQHAADPDDISGTLEQAVAGVDPADIVSLPEALEDPGPSSYSPLARERFSALAGEIRSLRRFVGEPLLDLVRRVIDVTGLEVELASSPSPVAASRRDNVATFLDAVASFAGIDGDASLPGLLAYLKAEEEYGQGLALAIPTEANSVKLLTVHRAKGLEWDVVFVPGMSAKVFPSALGRARWPTGMTELPSPLRGDAADLPVVRARSNVGLKEFVDDSKADELREERRLAYVAVTRPRHELVVSCHWWGPEQKRPRGPSLFMDDVIAAMRSWGDDPEIITPPPVDDAANPANRKLDRYPWPVEAGVDEVAQRREAAGLVEQARAVGPATAAQRADDELMLDELTHVAQWDREIARLVEEARINLADEIVVQLPDQLSATTLLRLNSDPEGLAKELARPMPRKPSPSARYGTRFHAWVEAHIGRPTLLDPDDLPGRADVDITGDDDLAELIGAFRAGPFGERAPYQVEAAFSLVLGGQVVRGRIDAVYQTPTGFLVVDWKTNRRQDADPLQLAVYRVAWAELTGVDPSQVEAAFYYVRSNHVVSHDDLPDRAALEQLVTAGSPIEAAANRTR